MAALRYLPALAALALVPAPAAAQQPFQMKGMGSMPLIMLLNSPDIQKDLKLTEEQTKAIVESFQEQLGKVKELFAGGLDKIKENIEAMIKESDKAARKVLKEDQLKRLDQIKMQADGPRAFRDPELLTLELKVTDEQKAKIEAVIAEAEKEMPKLFAKGRPTSREEMQKAMEEMQKVMKESNKKAMDKILAVLTAAQRERWEALIGPRFEGSITGGLGGLGGLLPFGKQE